MTLPNPPECRICRLPLIRSTLPRQNECPFCGRTFRRVDGAKRHTKTCPSRGSQRLPPDAKRGRKVHACDVCSRVKVSCDSKFPCSRCASRGLACTYRRLCTDPTHRDPSTSETRVLPNGNRLEFPFLLACTHPTAGTVDELLLTRESDHDTDQSAAGQAPEYHNIVLDTIDPQLLFLTFIDPSLDMNLDWQFIDDENAVGILPERDPGGSDEELQAQISLLQTHLEKMAALDPDAQNYFNTESSADFFTISSFRDCIRAFFRRKQLLATIVHRPTFHLQVDSTLLLAIAVSGFSYIHYRQNNRGRGHLALMLRGMAEKYIFHQVEQLLGSTACAGDAQRTLEVCQAAYMMATLQSCVKDAKVRQRLVTKYHPMLVNLLRSRGIVGTRHPTPETGHDWHTFAYRESCIRLLHWIFINDAWFTLFFNHPPAMTLFDMSSHLPCTEELWDADSQETFQSLRLQGDPRFGVICLKLLISKLLADEWTENAEAVYAQLNVDNFLVVIFAFQHVIFHYQTSILGENGSCILLRGLDRWNRLWQDAMDQISIEKKKALGLGKYSTELAGLTRRIVEAGNATEDVQPKYLQRIVTYDTVALHEFIKQCVE